MEDLEPVVMKDVGIRPKKKISIGYIILITIAVLIIAGIFGIFSMFFLKVYNKSRYKDEFYVQQEALEYLEKRYDEEFVVMYNRGMGPAYNYVQLYGYPKGYSDEKHKFEIQGYYNKWGKLDYYDSYVMVKLTDDYEAYLDPIIGEYFDDYKFFLEFHSEWLTNDLPPDTKVEDLWKLKANKDYPLPALFVYVSPRDDSKKELEGLLQSLKERHYRGRVDVWYMKEENRYTLANRDNWGDNMTYKDYDDMVTYFIYTNEIKSMEE